MLFPPVPSNNGHYNGVLEILQNIEKILQCKVHNIPPNHMQQACLARIFHEWPAATADMTALPGVLGCRTLRRTVQYASGPTPLRLPGTRRKRLRCAWHRSLHGLATAIHEISELAGAESKAQSVWSQGAQGARHKETARWGETETGRGSG